MTKHSPNQLNEDNYLSSVFVFRDRQAGIAEVYDPLFESFKYNAYCLEKKLLKELYTEEFEYLSDALEKINDEFGTWKIEEFNGKGCGSCAAKK